MKTYYYGIQGETYRISLAPRQSLRQQLARAKRVRRDKKPLQALTK